MVPWDFFIMTTDEGGLGSIGIMIYGYILFTKWFFLVSTRIHLV